MNEDQLALSGALRLVDLRHILDVFLEQTDVGLRDLTNRSAARSDADRKRALLLFLHSTRQRLLRILVIAKWTNKARVVAEVGRLLDVAARQAGACREAADQLAFLHAELEDARTPAYDVHTALHVLQTGGYDLLPACIEELRPPAVPPPAKRRAALRLMDQILRTNLLQVGLPAGVAVVSVGGGAATLRCGGLWEARLTMVPAPPLPSSPPAPTGSEGQPEEAAGQVAQAVEHPGQAIEQPGKPEQAAKDAKVTQLRAGVEEPKQDAGQQVGPAADAAQGALGLAHAVADTSAPASSSSAGAMSGVLGQQWRWRLLSMTVLPDCGTRDALLAPAQALQLRGAVEMRMWAASEAQEQAASVQLVLAQEQAASAVQHDPGHEAAGTSSGTPAALAALQQQPNGIAKEEPGEAPEAPAAPRPPLEVLQGILLDVGARLALNQAVSTARAVAAQGSGRWAGLIRLDRATVRPVGVRICYWLSMPTVSAAELPRLALLNSSPSADGPPGGAANPKGPRAHAPPAVEICISQEGHLMVASDPQLARPAAVLNGKARSGDEARVHLSLDLADLDAERVLLQAASANAAIQLAALDTVLRRRGNLANNGGATALLSPEPDVLRREQAAAASSPNGPHAAEQPAVNKQAPASPVLALRSGSVTLVQASVQLRTGRILLRAGDDSEASFGGPELELIMQREEDKLASIRSEALKAATQQPGLAAAEGMAKALELLWATLSMRARCAQLKAAGKALGLAHGQLPPALYKAYLAAGGAVQAPGKTVQYLAFPAAGFPSLPGGDDRGGEAWRECAERVLGRRAVRVRFLLGAEMCAGLRWRFLLLAVACNGSNLPVRILRAWPVPRDLPSQEALRHDVSASSAHTGASPGARPTGTAENQPGSASASMNGTTGHLERPAAAGAGNSGEALGGGRRAPEEGSKGAIWGREHAAELEEVVRWCAPKVAWEHLRLQLQVMGAGYTEEIALSPASAPVEREPDQDAGRHDLPNGHARHSSEEEEDTNHRAKRARLSKDDGGAAGHLRAMNKAAQNGESSSRKEAVPSEGKAEALPSPRVLRRVLQLHELHSLQLLDDLAGAQLWAHVMPGAEQGCFGGLLRSAYLGGLPASCAGCTGRVGGSATVDARRLAQTPSGVSLSYRSSAGDTAATLVGDIRRLIRLHLALARLSACMRAAAAAQPQPQQGPRATSSAARAQATPSQAAGAAAAAAAAVRHPGATHQQQQPSTPKRGPASTDSVPLSPPLTNGDISHEICIAGQEGGSGDDDISASAQDDVTGSASSSSRGPPLHWQAAEGCGVVRISAVGLTRAVIIVAAPGCSSSGATPADMQQPPGAPNRAGINDALTGSTAPPEDASLSVSMEWAADSCGAGGAAGDGQHTGAPEQSLGGGGNATARAGNALALRCRMHARPALPAAVLRALEDIAGCGEEELLLDALSVCGPALACLGALLAPAALLALGMLPEEASLEARRPPYLLRLVLHRGTTAEVTLGLHMLAGGLIWLAPGAAKLGAREQIMERLCCLSNVILPERHPSGAAEPPQVSNQCRQQAAPPALDFAMEYDRGGQQATEPEAKAVANPAPALGTASSLPGLWVRLSALRSAVETVLAFAVESVA